MKNSKKDPLSKDLSYLFDKKGWKRIKYKLGVSPTSFSVLLKTYRLCEEMTLSEMAGKLKISISHLSNIEKERKLVTVEKAKEFAKRLKDSEKYFILIALSDQLRKAGWNYHFKLHKEKKGYWAECIEIPGCITQGETLAELKSNAAEALNLTLDEPVDSKIIYPFPMGSIKAKRNVMKVRVDPSLAFAFLVRRTRLQKGLTRHQMNELYKTCQ